MIALVLVSLLLLIPGVAAADDYYNSGEPGCTGTDPNVLLCDDFERGTWYVNDGDHRTEADKGWGGTIYANPITPPGASICGAAAIFGNCSANGGYHGGGTGGRNMATHGFKGGGVDEVYVRWYIKWEAGYMWSAEKNMNITKAAGGIFYGNVHCNPGQGSRQSSCSLQWANYAADALQAGSVASPLNLQSGRVYFVEAYMRLNTPGQANGLMRLWTNDCGTDGKSCGAAPVLRQEIINIKFTNRKTTADKLEIVWLENWANNGDSQGSLGTGPYWDNLKVSKVGPIGFLGASTTPPPTVSYTLTTAVTGAGTVSGAGSYPGGTVVTPVALPASGSTFTGWSGDCTGTGACTVTMTGNKNVTATFTTPTTPPTGSVPPAPSSPTVTLGTTDPSGATFNVAWAAVTGATSYSYTAGLSDNSANLQGAVTPPNLLLKMPYMQNGAAGGGFVCIKSVNTAGASEDAACNSLTIPAKPAVIPPPLTTGTLTVDAQITRCNYFLTAAPPDATGGWVAQFYRDGSTKVGNPITAAPYKRSVELYAPSHSFSVQFTKTGSVMRSPAVVTRACP